MTEIQWLYAGLAVSVLIALYLFFSLSRARLDRDELQQDLNHSRHC